MQSLNDQYSNILYKLYYSPVINSRGFFCKEIINHTFIINKNDHIIKIPGFETNKKYADIELKWYLSATNRIDYDPVIEKTWKRFSDDGVVVNSAYGIRIFGKHPIITINQWKWCINKLRNDPGTRQAVININSWFDKEKETKDFVCTLYFHMFIRNNKLIWITNMRSQDVYYGTRNDIYCFHELHKLMAKELNIEIGDYIHKCNSIHIYESQFNKLNEYIKKIEKKDV